MNRILRVAAGVIFLLVSVQVTASPAGAASVPFFTASFPNGTKNLQTTLTLYLRDGTGKRLVVSDPSITPADVEVTIRAIDDGSVVSEFTLLEGGAGTEPSGDVIDNGDGTYSIVYTPPASGSHTATITVGGVRINGGRPVNNGTPSTVSSGIPSSGDSIALLVGNRINDEVSAIVLLRDTSNRPLTYSAGATVSVVRSGVNGNNVPMTVTDNGDGTFSATYTPSVIGVDTFVIKVNGIDIAGSYSLDIRDADLQARIVNASSRVLQGQVPYTDPSTVYSFLTVNDVAIVNNKLDFDFEVENQGSDPADDFDVAFDFAGDAGAITLDSFPAGCVLQSGEQGVRCPGESLTVGETAEYRITVIARAPGSVLARVRVIDNTDLDTDTRNNTDIQVVPVASSIVLDAGGYIEFNTADAAALLTANLDGDAYTDFLVRTASDIQVFLNDGTLAFDGSLASPDQTLSRANVADWQLADIDGDLDADLVLVYSDATPDEVLYFNGAVFSTVADVTLAGGNVPAQAVTVGDIDGVGGVEIVVARDDSVDVHDNAGALLYSVRLPEDAGTSYVYEPSDLRLVDSWNDDGLPELLVANAAGNDVLFFNQELLGGASPYDESNLLSSAYDRFVLPLELLTSAGESLFFSGLFSQAQPDAVPQLRLMSAEVAGAANTQSRIAFSNSTDLRSGDVDADGQDDVIEVIGHSAVRAWRNQNNGSVSVLPVVIQRDELQAAAIADVDGGGSGLLLLYQDSLNGKSRLEWVPPVDGEIFVGGQVSAVACEGSGFNLQSLPGCANQGRVGRDGFGGSPALLWLPLLLILRSRWRVLPFVALLLSVIAGGAYSEALDGTAFSEMPGEVLQANIEDDVPDVSQHTHDNDGDTRLRQQRAERPLYLGLDYGMARYEQGIIDPVEPAYVRFRLSPLIRNNWYFDAHALWGTEYDEVDIGGQAWDYAIDWGYSFMLRKSFPIMGKGSVHVLGGWTYLQTDVDSQVAGVKVLARDSGFSWAIGADVRITRSNFFGVEYFRFPDDGSYEMSAIHIGFRHRY